MPGSIKFKLFYLYIFISQNSAKSRKTEKPTDHGQNTNQAIPLMLKKIWPNSMCQKEGNQQTVIKIESVLKVVRILQTFLYVYIVQKPQIWPVSPSQHCVKNIYKKSSDCGYNLISSGYMESKIHQHANLQAIPHMFPRGNALKPQSLTRFIESKAKNRKINEPNSNISDHSFDAFIGKCPENSADGQTDGRTEQRSGLAGQTNRPTYRRQDGLYHFGRTNGQHENIVPPFPKFNDCAVEVWKWISYFIPHFMIDVNPAKTVKITA